MPIERAARRLVLWAWDRWRSNPLVTVMAWIEVCWGAWIFTNPPNGTSRIVYEAGQQLLGWAGVSRGGEIVGLVICLHGALRWAVAWRGGMLGVSVFQQFASLFTYWLMVWSVGLAQGWSSPLTILYLGLEFVNTYLFGCALADAETARSMQPPGQRGKVGWH